MNHITLDMGFRKIHIVEFHDCIRIVNELGTVAKVTVEIPKEHISTLIGYLKGVK